MKTHNFHAGRATDLVRGRTGILVAGAGGSSYNVVNYSGEASGTDADRVGIQAAIDAAHAGGGGIVFIPGGSYGIGGTGLVCYPEVTLMGAGRETTILLALANSINLVTVTGTAMESTYEVAYASPVVGIGFDANSHTSCVGLAYVGTAWWTVDRCRFKGFTTGLDFFGSLQAQVTDSKFIANTTGLKFTKEAIGYYGGSIPPSRVRVDFSSFFQNTSHAIDYSGGEQLILVASEFGYNGTAANAATSAVKFAGAGDPPGPGLVGHDLWIEGNQGLANIEIASASDILTHSLSDTWIAYGGVTYSISVDGSSAAATLLARNVRHDTAGGTVNTFYRTGSVTLDLAQCTGTLAGSGGTVRQDPLLSGQLVTDLSQFLALRLPNLTTTQRDAIAAPTAGMVIWNTTTTALNQYTGSAWVALAGGVTGFGTPALTLGTANAAGSATTAVRTDATVLAFDATSPTTQAVGDAAAVGTATVAARRDHKHAITRPTLDDLSDVVITSAAAGDRVRYDGSNFVNSALRWEPHVAYDGTVVLNGNGDPVMVEQV